MVAFAAKLCNPTPFKVSLPWHRGIEIPVEPFGSAEITMSQMDDFRPGKAGSAEVRSVLDYHGLFLLDSDRPYDNQALEALKRSHKAKKAQYDAAVKNLHVQRAQAGIAPNEAAFEETLTQLGLTRLAGEVEQLHKAIQTFESAVGTGPEKATRPKYDLNRTIVVMEPPREFPSVAAMEFFLQNNPEIRVKHEAFKARAASEEAEKVKVQTSTPVSQSKSVGSSHGSRT